MAESIGFAIKGTADLSDMTIKLDGVITKMEHAADGQTRLSQKTEEATQRVNRAREEQRRVNGLLVNSEDKVIEGLAKWRVKAGQYLDAQGEIRTKNGQYVRGLTVLQQKMGMYVDSTGHAHDATGKLNKEVGALAPKLSELDKSLGLVYDSQGRLTRELLDKDGQKIKYYFDELTDSQKRLKMHADEYGRILDKNDKFTGKYTKSAQEALRDQRDYQLQMVQTHALFGEMLQQSGNRIVYLAGAFQKISATIGHDLLARAGNTGTMRTLVQGLKDDWAATVESAKAAWAAIRSVGEETDEAGNKLRKGLRGSKKELAALGSAAWSLIAPAMTIGTVALPLIIEGVKWIGAQIKEVRDRPYKGLSDELKEIRIRAEEAGKAIKGIADYSNDVAIGVNGLLKTSFDSDLEKLRKEYTDAAIQLDAARADIKNRIESEFEFDNAKRFGVNPKTPDFDDPDSIPSIVLQEHIQPFLEKYNAAYTNFTTELARSTDALLDQFKLESERLADEKRDLETRERYLLKIAEDNPDDLDAQGRLTGIRRLIEEKNTAQLAALEKEKQGLDTSAKEAQARADALRAAGIDGFLKAQEGATLSFENLGKKLGSWFDLVEKGMLTSEEYDQAREKALEQLRQGLENELGVKWGEETSGIATQLAKLKTAVENQAITAEEQARATQQLYAKERDALAQKLGLELDARDELTKTYKEAAERVKEAFKKGEISKEDGRELLAAAKRRRLDSLRALAEETGVSLDAQGVPTATAEKKKVELDAAREYLAAVEKWKAKLADSEIANEAYEAAIEQLKARALAQAQEGWNGKDAEKQLAELQELRDAEIITEKKFDDAKKALTAQIEAAAKKQRLDNLRSELGVDSIMESLKTPAQRLKETMNKLAEAQKAGVISEKELAAVRSKAYQEYLDATQERGVEETLTKIKPEAKAKEKSDKTTAGESLSQGSESLYKAMLKRRAPTAYETKMQSAADRMCEFEALNYRNGLEQTDRLDVIANGFQALGNIRVFG